MMEKSTRVFPIALGQEVFLVPHGNIARQYRDTKPPAVKGVVEKIGRKYFYVRLSFPTWKTEKFERDTFVNVNEDINSSYSLWASPEDWDLHYITGQKLSAIRNFFSHYSLSISADAELIRDIYQMLQNAGCGLKEVEEA